MKKIGVIGAGPGRADQLTQEARNAIDRADVVFAFERHRALFEKAQPLEPLSTAPERIAACANRGCEVAVLVSGDPCLYSLLGLLQKKLGAENLRVIPGIGAVQALCASAGVLWQGAEIVSGHGRNLSVSKLGHAVRTHEKVLLFCDDRANPAWAARALLSENLEHVRLCVGERLSYPDERLTRGTPGEICEARFDPLCLVLIENPAPQKGLPPIGLPDECFVRGKIPMTKREIRMQVLAELALTPDAVVWDLGAGTGSVSVECARQCPEGEIWAVEKKPEGAALIRENAERLSVHNLHIVEAEAAEAMGALPAPTHVFIGGSGGQMKQMLEELKSRNRNIRVVATAVSLEGLSEMARLFEPLKNASLTQMAVTRTAPAGHYHLMQALNPIWIATGEMTHEE